MADSPLVSLYMTVKNGYPFVKDAINSVIGQSYKNWELIVVDDGSSDNTVDYLRSIENEDPRFKFIYTEGIGRAKALNLAVSYAVGDLIANLDADDLSHPDRLMRQVECFQSNSGLCFLCSKTKIFKEVNEIEWSDIQQDFLVGDVTKGIFWGNPVNHSSVMMRKDVFEKVGGYNDNLLKMIDFDLWCRLVLWGYKIYRVDDVLVGKRIHKKQSYENKNRIEYLMACFLIRKKLISLSGVSKVYHSVNLAIFVYGILPQKIRMLIRKGAG